jgi:ATP-binding cassette subfamily F protein 3
MLHVNDLSLSFGGEVLFKDLSFKLSKGDKIGLVGKNGAGKSTMLRILNGDQNYDSGQLALQKNCTLGMLKQDVDFEDENNIFDEACLAFEDLMEIETKLEQINKQLTERNDYESESYEKLLIDLSEYQQQYELKDGYNYQANVEKILKGLGFTREDFQRPTSELSGGWRMRIELAKLLLQDNDLLLLDEPTNHLDIESIIWFENFLKDISSCVVLVSHDKQFLDNVTNRTIELSFGQIYDYNKSYSEFKKLREEIKEQQVAAKKNQDKEIEQTQKLIDKFRAKANKASMAQSLIKKLEKTERIQVDQDDENLMNISFNVNHQPGKVIMKADRVAKRFGDKKVLNEVSFMIDRGDKIAFVGQNGQGKSTLAKIMIGELKHQGKFELGHNVDIGYFAQNQADYLNDNKTLIETMEEVATEKNHNKIRDILGSFLFSGDDVFKPVKVLSGGERNRLALAKLMLMPFNTLIMDEPTNHLDITSKNILKKALQNFQGTLILISHDRDFLQDIVEVIYEFRNHQVKPFLGTINEYLQHREMENMREVEASNDQKKQRKQKKSRSKDKDNSQLKRKLDQIESKISKNEKKLEEKDKVLADSYQNDNQNIEELETYNKLQSEQDKLMNEWEQLAKQMDD